MTCTALLNVGVGTCRIDEYYYEGSTNGHGHGQRCVSGGVPTFLDDVTRRSAGVPGFLASRQFGPGPFRLCTLISVSHPSLGL